MSRFLFAERVQISVAELRAMSSVPRMMMKSARAETNSSTVSPARRLDRRKEA